ncbi:MAG: hypothetical protein J2P48_17545 [Alphaproteobacteria bacterium]|nr:hypothetical protein [Alphaproteobacteria bacterium]
MRDAAESQCAARSCRAIAVAFIAAILRVPLLRQVVPAKAPPLSDSH